MSIGVLIHRVACFLYRLSALVTYWTPSVRVGFHQTCALSPLPLLIVPNPTPATCHPFHLGIPIPIYSLPAMKSFYVLAIISSKFH